MNRTYLTTLAVLALVALFSMEAMAATKSDYDRHYNFAALKTWNFAAQKSGARDLVGNNSLWDQRVRTDLEQQLAATGFTRVNEGASDFLITYHLGTKQRFETEYLHNGVPAYWGHWGRWGRWHPGWGNTTVRKIPLTESTLVMDVIDARTRQLIWRGYDTETIDFNKAEKTINKAVEHLTRRFVHDSRETAEKS
jgi:hypothetical protein